MLEADDHRESDEAPPEHSPSLVGLRRELPSFRLLLRRLRPASLTLPSPVPPLRVRSPLPPGLRRWHVPTSSGPSCDARFYDESSYDATSYRQARRCIQTPKAANADPFLFFLPRRRRPTTETTPRGARPATPRRSRMTSRASTAGTARRTRAASRQPEGPGRVLAKEILEDPPRSIPDREQGHRRAGRAAFRRDTTRATNKIVTPADGLPPTKERSPSYYRTS